MIRTLENLAIRS